MVVCVETLRFGVVEMADALRAAEVGDVLRAMEADDVFRGVVDVWRGVEAVLRVDDLMVGRETLRTRRVRARAVPLFAVFVREARALALAAICASMRALVAATASASPEDSWRERIWRRVVRVGLRL